LLRWLVKIISQRKLRNENGEVMRGVERGVDTSPR
jgi:hypothetical protein